MNVQVVRGLLKNVWNNFYTIIMHILSLLDWLFCANYHFILQPNYLSFKSFSFHLGEFYLPWLHYQQCFFHHVLRNGLERQGNIGLQLKPSVWYHWHEDLLLAEGILVSGHFKLSSTLILKVMPFSFSGWEKASGPDWAWFLAGAGYHPYLFSKKIINLAPFYSLI